MSYIMKPLTLWSQIDGSGQLSSQQLARGTRTNTLKAITGKIKVTESIGGHVGGYNFSPTLIASSSRRKQCPLYSANPHGQTESSLLGCAGSESLQQRLVAEFFEGSASQAKRLCQSRYGPVEFSWTRTMSIPFHCRGATTV